MIFFFIILGLACVLGAAAGYFLLRRWGTGSALFGSLLGLLAGSLLFPFPIHGGVMFLGQVLWGELQGLADRQAERQEQRRDEGFRHAMEQRFAGDIAFVPGQRLAEPWMEALLEDGSVAWFDTQSGLVWSDAQTVPSWEFGGDLDVKPGRAFCTGKKPDGYWALPSEGELFTFWEHAGYTISPWTGQSTPGVLIDETLHVEIPVWYRGAGQSVAVRCVARSPRAPMAGYFQSDVDIERWNRYQMEKAQSLRGLIGGQSRKEQSSR